MVDVWEKAKPKVVVEVGELLRCCNYFSNMNYLLQWRVHFLNFYNYIDHVKLENFFYV